MEFSLFKKYYLKDNKSHEGDIESIENLIIVNHALETNEEELLSNIYKAINIDVLKSCLIIDHLDQPDFRINQLQNFKNIKHIFLYGISPMSIGLNLNLIDYSTIEHLNVKYLKAADISLIHEQKALKLQLWNALKAL